MGEVEVYLHTFLTSALHEGEWQLYPRRKKPGTYWTGGWVGPRDARNAVTRRENMNSCRVLNSGRPARGLVTILTATAASLFV